MITDFEYAGERLSDYGCIIGFVDGSSSNTLDWANNLQFNTITRHSSGVNRYASTSYDDVYSTTFQVVKYDCDSRQFFDISDAEYRQIVKWLNRKSYEKFVPITDDDQYADCYFKGSFNVDPIIIGGKIAGLELTFTSNAPYGYGDLVEIEASNDSNTATGTFVAYSTSDETGISLAYMEITVKIKGTIGIINCADGSKIEIKNCVAGEVITLDGVNRIITSSKTSHSKLYNDFNYVYPHLVTDYNNKENIFIIYGACDIYMSYTPIRKIGVIV